MMFKGEAVGRVQFDSYAYVQFYDACRITALKD